MNKIFFAFMIIFLVACSSGGGSQFDVLYKPSDIVSSSTNVEYNGRSTRLVYVANRLGGTVSVLAQDEEKIIDTDRDDDFDDSPLIIGGEPTSLVVQERGTPRVFVADAFHRRIVAYELAETSREDEVAFVPLDLSEDDVAVVSEPLFRNSGRLSNPTLVSLSVTSDVKTEHWDLLFEGDDTGYRVEGSKSGIQTQKAQEGEVFSTDDGAVTFTVKAGGERTTGDDRFRFGTAVLKPLALTGKPVDLIQDENRLFILMNDPPSIASFDLETLSLESTVNLVDTSVLMGEAALVDGRIYVPNLADTTVLGISKENFNDVTEIEVEETCRVVRSDSSGTRLFLMSVDQRKMLRWNLSTESLEEGTPLTDYGYDFIPYVFNDDSFALIPLASGAVDVFDLQNQIRWDARITDDTVQSDTTDSQFFDSGMDSSPELVSVNTRDRITLSEQWQLVFEGVVPGTAGLTGELAGQQLSVAEGTDLEALGIQIGDRIIFESDSEEALVEEVDSPTTLILDISPQNQGDVTFSIRPSGQYIVLGSLSGPQIGRVEEGVSYTSDENEISLTIRGSRSAPTTQGDFFSFYTLDGIDPIRVSGKRGAMRGTAFIRPGETFPTAYLLHQASNAVTAFHLNPYDLYERRTIR